MAKYITGINHEIEAESPEDAQRQFAETLHTIMAEDYIEEHIEVTETKPEHKAAHLHIDNAEFMDCLNRAKQKMVSIEEKHSKDFIASQDLIARVGLCIYDTVHDFINEKLKHS